ncbi:NUMOD4 motif-containing HNH endonuclease [Streptomyces sp. NPDC059340]|uniref:NUMOD4 motif-containing HNH endonuclease n=1 Tax=Streptomyces sp. NPDC059340 TaxID=3346806 RepID=UPI0036CFBEA8
MSAVNEPISAEGLASPEPTWRPVPGHEGNYEVSDQGDIRSRPRPRTKGGLRRATISKVGYPKVELWSNGRRETRFVHQIVAAAFLGPRPDGQEVRHLDGNPLNCELSNLAYGTRSENSLDKVRHGTDHNANKTHCPQDHPYDEANTARYRGRRTCRTCANHQARLRYWQRKALPSKTTPDWTPGGAR